jgi:hypothetical protein
MKLNLNIDMLVFFLQHFNTKFKKYLIYLLLKYQYLHSVITKAEKVCTQNNHVPMYFISIAYRLIP